MPALLIPRSPAHILSTVGCNAVYSRQAKSRIRYADMLSSPCLRAACLRQEMIRTSRVAGIWFAGGLAGKGAIYRSGSGIRRY
jgi:hypothetical protein